MSDTDYAVNLEPYDVKEGREILARSNDGALYAGEYLRNLVETTDTDEFLVGHFDDPVRGEYEPAWIPFDAMARHAAYIGATGYGKSSAMRSQVRQLAERGNGLLYVDPKGQDARRVLESLPEERLDDVVWVEPGRSDKDTMVGFNIFETYHEPGDAYYETEVQELIQEVLGILKMGKQGWGATMDSVAEAVSRQLIRAEEEYTIFDMYKILADKDEREEFAEEFGDEVESIYFERLVDMDTEELDPLLRRIQKWGDYGGDGTRPLVAHPNGLSFGEMVNEDRIVIVDLSNINSSMVMGLAGMTVTRFLWAAKKASDPESRFGAYIEEADVVAEQFLGLESMLSKGRGYGFAVNLSFQSLKQLPDEEEDALLGNCDNIFAFNPGEGNVTGAGQLAQVFDIGANRLLNLSQFEFVGRLYKDKYEKTDAFDITSIPPHPPLRTGDDLDAIIEESLDRYGSKSMVDTWIQGEY